MQKNFTMREGHLRKTILRVHKKRVQEQLLTVKKTIEESPYGEISYAKIILEQSALAKSHRPTKSLFKRKITPIVGGGDLGELYVELTPQTINQMIDTVSRAEETTTKKICERRSGDYRFPAGFRAAGIGHKSHR